MLADKDAGAVVEVLQSRVTQWLLVGLDTLSARGLSAAELAARLPGLRAHLCSADVHSALEQALQQALAQQARLLICGSFVLAEQVLRWSGWDALRSQVSFSGERQ